MSHGPGHFVVFLFCPQIGLYETSEICATKFLEPVGPYKMTIASEMTRSRNDLEEDVAKKVGSSHFIEKKAEL